MVTSLSAWGLETPKTLQGLLDAAAPGTTIQLPSGVFEGRAVIRKPVRLVGAGPETVIQAASGITLSVGAQGVELQQLSVQGEVAVQTVSRAALVVSHVSFQGRQVALALGEGAQVSLNNVDIVMAPRANEPCEAGISVQHAALKADHVTVVGRCRRSFDSTTARLQLTHLSLRGATATGLQFVDSEVEFEDVDVTSESTEMAAAFAARSFVKGTGLILKGGFQGWLQKGGKTELSDARIEGSPAAGVAIIGGTGEFNSTKLTGPFSQAGFFISDNALLTLRNAETTRTGAAGVLVNRSDARVSASHFSGTRFDHDGDFGHAIAGEGARIAVSDVVAEDVEGAAVYASQSPSLVSVSKLALVGVGAGMVAVNGARLIASDVSGSAKGVVAFSGGHSTIELSRFDVRAPMGSVECDGATVQRGADVKLVAETNRLTCSAGELDATWRRLMPRWSASSSY